MSTIAFLRRTIFGEDVFISYSRADGMDYALGVAAGLEGLACYLDQLDTQPGQEVPKRILARLKSSTVLVLLATTGAVRSPAVKQEVRAFLETGRPIIPVSIGGALEASDLWPVLQGAAVSQIIPDLSEGESPNAELLRRIDSSFTYTRRSQWLRRIAIATVSGVVVLLALAATASWVFVREASRKADALVAEAQETARRTVAEAQEEAESMRNRANDEAYRRHMDETNEGKR